MAVRGRWRYLPNSEAVTSSTAEMGAAFLSSVNNMEGPNSLTSSPSPFTQMESDSPHQLSLWTLDESLTLGDFVNPLDIFNSATKTTDENVCQQQSSDNTVNVFEDLEAGPIDIEELLKDPTSVDELCKIVTELEEATGTPAASFDLVSYVEQQPEPVQVFEPEPSDVTIPSTSNNSSILSTINEAVLDSVRTTPCSPEPVLVQRSVAVKRTRPPLVEPATKRSRSIPEPSPASNEDVKRERNKQASRKSRQKRKLKDAEMQDEAVRLERHNKILLEQISELENLKNQIEAEIKKHFPALSR